MYALDVNAHVIFKFDTTGTISEATQVGEHINNFVIDLNDAIIPIVTNLDTKAFVDSDNSVWKLVGANVWRDNEIMYHVGSDARHIAIDQEDNCWITYGKNKVIKITKEGRFVFDIALPDIIDSDDLTINFSRELTRFGFEDYAWVGAIAQNKLIKISQVGNIVQCVDVQGLFEQSPYDYTEPLDLYIRGDVTGYDAQRKYGLPLEIQGRALTARIVLQEDCDGSTTVAELHRSADNIAPGWHHVMCSVNTVDGHATLYVDGGVADTYSFEANAFKVSYQYKPPFLIGADSGKFQPLAQEIGLEDPLYFVGQIDDVRYYDRDLTLDEVRSLYWRRQEFEPVTWNIPTTEQPYMEQVERFFKHKMPGQKSASFDIKIKGLQIEDEALREVIEESISESLEKIKPGYSQLRQIEWL
tara:strand:- start:523 stop:1764 length:1242 start_codon:yes stop_codon:yes gene_type:complete